jgi:hypothetical protein
MFLVQPLAAYAQTPPQPDRIVINYVTLTPPEDQQAGQPTLEVFFTVMDDQGQPISQPDIDTARFLLDGQADETAIVSDPESPIYIAMLIDASGSMRSNMEAVRQAARNAIREAPAGTPFAVFKFSKDRTLMRTSEETVFSADAIEVENAIRAINAVPDGPTCLYDAVYDTVRDLKREVPEQYARRALIAFTDGVDELGENQGRCSQREPPEVVQEARSTEDRGESPVPIYTIGLCNDTTRNPCTYTESITFQGETFDVNPLAFLADSTNGILATGELSDVTSSFDQIMDGLNSQWLARANVFASRGRNEAVLEVTFRDGLVLQSGAFDFIAEAEYTPLPMVTIVRAQYVEDQYALELDLTNPTAIGEITVGIFDEEEGTELSEQTFSAADIRANLADQQPFGIDTSNFQLGREYCFRVRATDTQGQPLRNPGGLNAMDNNLDQQCVMYDPQIDFSIDEVSQNMQQQVLRISLVVNDESAEQILYDVSIIDAETNQTVDADMPPQVLHGEQIEFPIPQAIRQADEHKPYNVRVTLRKEGEAQGTRKDYSVNIGPPGFFQRIFMVFGNPFMLGFLFLVFAGITGWIVYPKLRGNKKKQPPRPQIYNDKTIMPGRMEGFSPPRMELAVRIVQTPDASQKQQKLLKAADVPFVIGRGSTADLRVTGDKEISREHVQLMIQGNTVTITDLNSSNGTFIGDKRLVDNEAVSLVNKTVVYLGTQTCLEIEPVIPQH